MLDSEPLADEQHIKGNVAELALEHGRRSPHRVAIQSEDEQGGVQQITFGELLALSERYAQGLNHAGLRPNDRIALLFRPCVDFYGLLLAALARRNVVVLIDASLSPSGIRSALRSSAPSMIISSRRVLRWWPLIPELRGVKRVSTDGWVLGTSALPHLKSRARLPLVHVPAEESGDAVISFTSGTGGAATAARRSHALLLAQHQALKATFPVAEGARNMPFFPLVTLHNLCCGVTTILPPMDPRHPTDAAVARTVGTIEEWHVDDLCIAPDALDRLVAVTEMRAKPIERIRRIAVGGGPVDRALARRIPSAFPNAEVHVVYGCTEAEPISVASLDDVRAIDGDGCLVGTPVANLDVVLASIPDDTLVLDSATVQTQAVSNGEVGEIIVRGNHVLAGAVSEGSIHSGWHRTGDLARKDASGRLWLLGRKGDSVMHEGRTVFPLAVENAARGVAGVARAAFVAVEDAPEGVLVFTTTRIASHADVLDALRAMLNDRDLYAVGIRHVETIPTDARHRSKIDRIALRKQLTGRAQ